MNLLRPLVAVLCLATTACAAQTPTFRAGAFAQDVTPTKLLIGDWIFRGIGSGRGY